MKHYTLKPIDGRKSFYNKCEVIEAENGLRVLQSYATLVAYEDKKGFHRLWSGWSATTSRHINAFMGRSVGKKEWESMKVEKLSDSEQYQALEPLDKILLM